MEYISLVIAVLGFLASVYYSNRSNKRGDDEAKRKEEDRQKREIESAKKEAERNAEINYKLDSVLNGVNSSNSEIKDIKKDLSALSRENLTMARDMKALSNRVESVEEHQKVTDEHLALLHREHREHVGMEDAAHHAFHNKHLE